MKIKAVHIIGDGLPGMATKCFMSSKGDAFALGMGCVFVTTKMNGGTRHFALPLAGVRMELDEIPELDPKAAKK